MAMSGGVDSSVAAALLVEKGYEVVGATMKTFCYEETPENPRTCCGLDGILDARRVADRLGVPHYVFDVEEDFTRDVIDDFVEEYALGRTPNPCVNCNGTTKFAGLLERGEALGCDTIASGHYVRIVHEGGRSRLLRGLDPAKDQSYYMWGVPAELLPRLLFPVGELTKAEVRERARALGLATAEKPESQDICFVPAGSYRDLLARRLPARHPALQPGPVVTRNGDLVGRHDGYSGFTVGQRRGLGGGMNERMFVLEIRPETREVVVGARDELYAKGVEINSLNWLGPEADAGERLRLQIRYRGAITSGTVVGRDSTGSVSFEFDEPVRAVSPGQSAVFLTAADEVRGGGRIERAQRLMPDALANSSIAESSSSDRSFGMVTLTST
ncbi:MAG: tRNA 2-thiouridine(34) synthase MnmA [Gemmatimonadetes bacterium]|nr:tRNA 2-thiouridine(34) synthase MnmA [Gemmatimonadota bacterium]